MAYTGPHYDSLRKTVVPCKKCGKPLGFSLKEAGLTEHVRNCAPKPKKPIKMRWDIAVGHGGKFNGYLG